MRRQWHGQQVLNADMDSPFHKFVVGKGSANIRQIKDEIDDDLWQRQQVHVPPTLTVVAQSAESNRNYHKVTMSGENFILFYFRKGNF